MSKSIPVEDVNGNKHVLKATVISVDASTMTTGRSADISDQEFEHFVQSANIVRPPLSQAELSILSEYSSELGPAIDSMMVGIEGFGGRLLPRPMPEEMKEKNTAAIAEERSWLSSLIKFPNPKGSLVRLRKRTRKDLESTGNAYWELIRSPSRPERFSCINKLDAATMFISKPDKKFTRMEVKYVDEDLTLRSKNFQVKFRRFVQIVNAKRAWFKEFGDPRIISRRDGLVIAPSMEEFKKLDARAQENNPPSSWATEVFHFRIESARRSPYGMPRFTGNIIAIKGSRGAEETNIITQQNNHVPSMAVLVSGGALTEGSISRIKEFVDTQIKGNSNYSKFLIIEGENTSDALSGAGSAKVEIKALSEAQIKDELWQEYDNNNAAKVRRAFRLPPIMVGKTEDLNRSTAQESERLAEKYVYNPEREEMDEVINQIFMQQGFRFWFFKSNSPNVTNDEDLVKILTGAEKAGCLTPRIGRMILEDILNRELPPLKTTEDFDPDLPFSLCLARLMQSAGFANQNGTFAPQGQIPTAPGEPGRPATAEAGNPANSSPSDDVQKRLDPHEALKDLLAQPEKLIESLTTVRDALGKELAGEGVE